MRKTAVLLLALAVVVPSTAAGATAAKPCWQRAIEDWYDGSIATRWSCACVREAIRHLPTTGPTYSTVHEDFQRAERRACTTRVAAGLQPAGSRTSAWRDVLAWGAPAGLVAAGAATVAFLLLRRRRA